VAVAAHDASGLATRWERLLDLDGDLADSLGEHLAARARDRIGVATVRLEQGSWSPHALTPVGHDAFALLVCDGLIVRELELAGTLAADLLGPGDIVPAGQAAEPLLITHERWHVSGAAKIAILDSRVLPGLHAWTPLSARLIARTARQAARAAEQRAISQLPRVELRIRAVLWHLADRWGRMGPSGVIVPIELTHVALGHLVGARRSTITLALSELSRLGMVVRRDDGAWILRQDSNPSGTGWRAAAVAGVAAIELRHRRSAQARVSHQADGAALMERVHRVRMACVREQQRTLEILARCRATRDGGANRREQSVSPPPAVGAPPS
jgi:CRP/FNR family cyclic AMP-dependent transcriptional regulator